MHLDDSEVRAAYYVTAAVLRSRRRTGEPIPAAINDLYAKLDQTIRHEPLSESRHEKRSDTIESDVETELIGSLDAAEMLGLSKRHTQRLAADLDGQFCSGRWLFKKSTVIDYRDRKKSP